MRNYLQIISLLAFVSSCALPVNVMDLEAYKYFGSEFNLRSELGSENNIHIDNSLKINEFLSDFDANKYPGTILNGPYKAGDEIYGGSPERVNYRYVYILVDSKGALMRRFFFDEDKILIRMDFLAQELGVYDFYDFTGISDARR